MSGEPADPFVDFADNYHLTDLPRLLWRGSLLSAILTLGVSVPAFVQDGGSGPAALATLLGNVLIAALMVFALTHPRVAHSFDSPAHG